MRTIWRLNVGGGVGGARALFLILLLRKTTSSLIFIDSKRYLRMIGEQVQNTDDRSNVIGQSSR